MLLLKAAYKNKLSSFLLVVGYLARTSGTLALLIFVGLLSS